jgi:hypothetical protein
MIHRAAYAAEKANKNRISLAYFIFLQDELTKRFLLKKKKSAEVLSCCTFICLWPKNPALQPKTRCNYCCVKDEEKHPFIYSCKCGVNIHVEMLVTETKNQYLNCLNLSFKSVKYVCKLLGAHSTLQFGCYLI